ncbi:KilA-N domain, partial [Dysosmobacter welbionis]
GQPAGRGVVTHIGIDIALLHAACQRKIIVGVPEKPDGQQIDPVVQQARRRPGGSQPFRFLAGAFLPENHLADDARDDKVGEQKPVAHQEKNHAKQRHIDQRHKPLADPADHEHIDRRAEEHGDPHRQHHADKVVGHADHVDNELDHDQHRRKQHRCNNILNRPFICFFHKRLLVFDTLFSNITLGILFIS